MGVTIAVMVSSALSTYVLLSLRPQHTKQRRHDLSIRWLECKAVSVKDWHRWSCEWSKVISGQPEAKLTVPNLAKNRSTMQITGQISYRTFQEYERSSRTLRTEYSEPRWRYRMSCKNSARTYNMIRRARTPLKSNAVGDELMAEISILAWVRRGRHSNPALVRLDTIILPFGLLTLRGPQSAFCLERVSYAGPPVTRWTQTKATSPINFPEAIHESAHHTKDGTIWQSEAFDDVICEAYRLGVAWLGVKLRRSRFCFPKFTNHLPVPPFHSTEQR